MNWWRKDFGKLVYGGLFLFCVTIFVVHFAISGQAVYGDGIGYYSHLHSWVIDGDWDYTNEYKHIYDHEHNNAVLDSQVPVVQIVGTSKDGRAENFYGTGVAVLLLPFYILAHVFSLLLNLLGAGVSTQGYGDVYQILSGIGAVFYTVLGVYFLEEMVEMVIHNRFLSRISCLTLFLSTNLFYYGSFDVINSHFASFFLATLFFYLFLGEAKTRSNLLLGLVAGLMTITRPQDAAVVLIWIIEMLMTAKEVNRFHWINFVTDSVRVFLIGLFFGIIPLMIHWSTVFGSPLAHPYVRGIWERLESGHSINLLGSLFDPITGLFSRTPILLVLFGYCLYLSLKRKMTILIYPLVFFLIQFLIITFQGGWAAAAYGGRMYISSMVLFGLLLGMLLTKIYRRSRYATYWLVCVFILLNFFSMARFILHDKGIAGGGHGTEIMTKVRLEKLFK